MILNSKFPQTTEQERVREVHGAPFSPIQNSAPLLLRQICSRTVGFFFFSFLKDILIPKKKKQIAIMKKTHIELHRLSSSNFKHANLLGMSV